MTINIDYKQWKVTYFVLCPSIVIFFPMCMYSHSFLQSLNYFFFNPGVGQGSVVGGVGLWGMTDETTWPMLLGWKSREA